MSVRRAYHRALAHVTDPDRTLLAVDRPYLVDYGKLDLKSMDTPGWAAPDGKFPFFKGTESKIATLRDDGFDTLIATVPATDICLASARRPGFGSKPAPYNRYDRYYLDWTDAVTEIATRSPGAVRRIGPLLVIDLKQAQRDLA